MTTDPTPAQADVWRCIDEYGALGVILTVLDHADVSDPAALLELAQERHQRRQDPDRQTPARPMVTPREFRDRGYLMEINRRVLHPLGMALALFPDDTTPHGWFEVAILDHRDDPEGYLFTDLTDDNARQKWATVEHELAAKAHRRLEVLGDDAQPIPSHAVVQAIGTKLTPDTPPTTTEERPA